MNGRWKKVGDVTFSRNSIATLLGKIYAVNEPRITSDGLLVTPSATNLFTPDSMALTSKDGGYDNDGFNLQLVDMSLPIRRLTQTTGNVNPVAFRNIPLSFPTGTLYTTMVYKKIDGLVTYGEPRDVPNIIAPSFTAVEGIPQSGLWGYTVIDYVEYAEHVIVRLGKAVNTGLAGLSCKVQLGSIPEAERPDVVELGIVQVSKTLSEYIPTTSTPETQGADNASFDSALLGDGDWTIALTLNRNNPITSWKGVLGIGAGSSGLLFKGSYRLGLYFRTNESVVNTPQDLKVYRIVAVKYGNNFKLYCNDHEGGEGVVPSEFVLGNKIEIGASLSINDRYINETENNIRISQRAWSQEEIDAYRNS